MQLHQMSSEQNGVTVTLSRTFCVLYAEHPTDRHPEESRQPNMFQQAVMVEWKVHLSIGVCTQAAEPCTGEAPYKSGSKVVKEYTYGTCKEFNSSKKKHAKERRC